MFTYILEKDKLGNRAWFLKIIDYDSIEKAVSIWIESSTRQLINGRMGLSVDFIIENSVSYKLKLKKLFDEGEIVLVNKAGGYHLLTESSTILKEIKDKFFPEIHKDFLNGILKGNGEFLKCEYGHHYEIAKEITKDEANYIVISHDDIGSNSSLFIAGEITKEQKQFIKENIEKFDNSHISELEKIFVI